MHDHGKKSSALHPIEMALGVVAAAAFLGGCSGQKPAEAPRPIVSTAAPAAEPIQPTGTDGVSTPPSVAPPSAEEVRAAWREGVALFEKGDYVGASSRLQIAAERRPDQPYAQYLLGIALWKAGDLEGAGPALERAATLDPKSVRR